MLWPRPVGVGRGHNAELVAVRTARIFRETLPYYAISRYVEVTAELPKNAVGRVRKHLPRERGVTPETWDFDDLGLTVGRSERR